VNGIDKPPVLGRNSEHRIQLGVMTKKIPTVQGGSGFFIHLEKVWSQIFAHGWQKICGQFLIEEENTRKLVGKDQNIRKMRRNAIVRKCAGKSGKLRTA